MPRSEDPRPALPKKGDLVALFMKDGKWYPMLWMVDDEEYKADIRVLYTADEVAQRMAERVEEEIRLAWGIPAPREEHSKNYYRWRGEPVSREEYFRREAGGLL